MKARLFLIALFVLNIFQMSAQSNDEVTLVVSADGATKEEATKVALRSAIEQAYGTFVSANTTILNDEMVKDEIVSISNGNIKEYKEIASLVLPNGKQSITLEATVCISKLISYAQSKGATAEFAGAVFAMNIKMKELNKKNEMIALNNLFEQLIVFVPLMYDRELEVSDPIVLDNGDYMIKMKCRFVGNDNKYEFYKILTETLYSLCLSTKEKNEYNSMNMKYSTLTLCPKYGMKDVELDRLSSGDKRVNYYVTRKNPYYLRNNPENIFNSGEKLFYLICREFNNYIITDNLGKIHAQGGTFDVKTRRNSVLSFESDEASSLSEMSYYIIWKGKELSGVIWDNFNLNPTFDLKVTIPKDYIMKINNFSIKRKN